MRKSFAIAALSEAAEFTTALADALKSSGCEVLISPDSSERDVMRWVMQLEPRNVAQCIVIDSEGVLAVSAVAALDPAVSVLIWSPYAATGDRLLAMAAQTRGFWSFAKDATAVAKNLTGLMNVPGGFIKSETETDPPADAQKREDVSAEAAPNEDQTGEIDQDHEMLRELEIMMALGKKTLVKKEPVQIQAPALDFSLPLREVMSAGLSAAAKAGHPEVLGVHYLAQLKQPYRAIMEANGVGVGVIAGLLSSLDLNGQKGTELVVSDEVFQAVSFAKDRARTEAAECVRVIDFLAGLFHQPAESISHLMNSVGIQTDALWAEILAVDPGQEACGQSFFKPSSLDQAGFYEFDEGQVQDIAGRLKDLPGFQKAAERVAETRPKSGEAAQISVSGKKEPAPSMAMREPEPPPETPDVYRVRGDFPSVEIIEQTADLLLEGQIVAFPTDIMTALAVDAANPAAVRNLRSAAAVPDDKPLSILINSTAQLKHLVRADIDALETMLDDVWPGPVTLIFKAAGGLGRHLSSEGKIAIRLPNDNIALAILSMLGRPLAVTSWDEETEGLTGQVAAILSGEDPPPAVRTTIIDLTAAPWSVVREGAVASSEILKHDSQ